MKNKSHCFIVVLLATCIISASANWARADTAPADAEAVKHVLAVATSSPIDAGALRDAVAKIGEAGLRQKVTELLPELQAASAKHARVVAVVADLKAIHGVTETVPGGPAWLRAIAGDSSMQVFDRLVAVDINDKQSPHNKDYHLIDTIQDEWVARLDGLTDIERLNLSNTAIKGPGLKYVGSLTNLEALSLTLCPVTDDYLESLKNLSNLKRFSLASAKCNGTGFRFLGKMTKLENLNFHYTPVNDDGLREICRMTSLERLEVVHTHFTDSGAANLANLKNIQRLQIGSRTATGASVAFLRDLPKLKELDLHDLENAPLAVKNAAGIQSLTVLRLYLGGVKDAEMKEIAKLGNLQELIIGGAQITDAGVASLGELKKLKKLTLGGTKVSPAAMEKLKAALPGLEVAP